MPDSPVSPMVSIVIPVYNGTDYLAQAIDSALAQTYPHCEILVINDGSTDGGATEGIARSYGERIRYFHKENGGVASALNLGIEQMRGELFSWLSHDDLFLPDKTATQVAFWQTLSDPLAVVYAPADIVDAIGHRSTGKRLPELCPEDFFQRLWCESFLNGCTMLIPVAALRQCGEFRTDLPTTQDYDLWFRLCGQVPFHLHDKVALLSRHHAEQGSVSREHRVECAQLYARFLPALVERCMSGKTTTGYAVLARSLWKRTVDYGAPFVRLAWPILTQDLAIREQARLCASLLWQSPPALARYLWCRLPDATRVSTRARIQRFKNHAHRFRIAVRQGGLHSALGRARRYAEKWLKQKQRTLDAEPASAFPQAPASDRPLHLVLDHDSGGGTQTFREQYTDKLLAGEADVLLWQYLGAMRRHVFTLMQPNGERVFFTDSFHQARQLVRAAHPKQVWHNNLVGWPDLPEVINFLNVLADEGTRLEIYLHDYFAACPVYTLLNREGVFCGLPTDRTACARCLPGHPLAAPYTRPDITDWRRMWETFLSKAAVVQVPDSSVREIFAKVYPEQARRMQIAAPPQAVKWQPLPGPGPEAPTIVGVVGYITRHKGAGIVEDLVSLIDARALPIRVVVIGDLESSLRSPALLVTGRYKHEDLPSLVARHNITVGLVPSPCPETFCYVAQEIMDLGLPLVSLDLGAQGRRTREYANGAVADTFDAQGCLEAVLRLEERRRNT